MITVVDKFTKYSINESWNHVVKKQKTEKNIWKISVILLW